MNEYSGYAHPVPLGWWAMLRFARDAKPKPVLGERGAPIVFATELEALRAVNKHLVGYLNGPEYRRCGEKLERFASAESHFNLPPIRSKGRGGQVEKRRAEV